MILIWGYLNMLIYVATLCGICFVIGAFYHKGMLDHKVMKEYDQVVQERQEKLKLIKEKSADEGITIKLGKYIETEPSNNETYKI